MSERVHHDFVVEVSKGETSLERDGGMALALDLLDAWQEVARLKGVIEEKNAEIEHFMTEQARLVPFEIGYEKERIVRERSDARVLELEEALMKVVGSAGSDSPQDWFDAYEVAARALKGDGKVMPCGHPVSALSEMQPDFLGDTPATQRIGTVHCRECERIARGGEK